MWLRYLLKFCRILLLEEKVILLANSIQTNLFTDLVVFIVFFCLGNVFFFSISNRVSRWVCMIKHFT